MLSTRTLLGWALAAALAAPATAQEPAAPPIEAAAPAPVPGYAGEGVAAVVNDDVISTYDLRQRALLLIITAGVRPTEQQLPQIQQQALRSLIEERLQLQELERWEVDVTDADIDAAIGQLAAENQTSVEAMTAALAQGGVSMQTLRQQYRTQIGWQRLVGGRYGSRLRVGDDQVTAALERINQAASQPQFLVSEVYIEAARVGGMDEAMSGATQLAQQLEQGAPFSGVARQFSAAPTAARGGDAGWLSASDMDPAVAAAVQQMRPGQVSQPIQVEGGVYIIGLRDKRTGAAATMVNLKQVAVRLGADASEADVAAARSKLEAIRPRITSCAVLEEQARGVEGVVAGDLGESAVTDLAPDFRQAAETLQQDQVSAPIRTPVGLHLIAMCGKRQAGAGAPTRDQVEDRLYNQQLSMLSRRYLRDLRNSATIEIK